MNRKELFEQVKKKRSYLCIGLDSDIKKIPKHLLKAEDPIFEFNKQIIEATHHLCVAYKPNLAFYESLGAKGWRSLEKTLEIIPKECFTIADAKRGDIGNTSTLYARAFFETLNFDAVTIAPYMGEDSVKPFLQFDGKWAIVLALTSNAGASDFQFLKVDGNTSLYKNVIEKVKLWGTADNLMLVVGATRDEQFEEVRKLAPDHFFLVPGIGAQGGDLNSISRVGMNDHCGLIMNSSRQIIYAGDGENFAELAKQEAESIQQEMEMLLREKNLIL
ncbi:orotidine-5'-phosphate decarboxylase [soil metagenome]